MKNLQLDVHASVRKDPAAHAKCGHGASECADVCSWLVLRARCGCFVQPAVRFVQSAVPSVVSTVQLPFMHIMGSYTAIEQT